MRVCLLLWLGLALSVGHAASVDELIADRTAIERVYYQHRLNATQPFEQAVPAAGLRHLVERDLAREQALHSHYGIDITPKQIAAEIERIDHTTRAPEVLAQIKTALGNDPQRYAESFIKPLLVERELRNRFANDDNLHASRRHECELARTNLLAARLAGAAPAALVAKLTQAHPGNTAKITWSLTPPPAAPATSKPGDTLYFDNLPPELRHVLTVQLRQPGDISAVIETPESFVLFVAESKTPKQLIVASLTLSKMDCDTWLATQNFPPPR